MAFSYKDNSAKVRKQIEAAIGKRLDAAAILTVNHVRTMISVEGAAKGAPGRNSRGRYTKGRLVYGANPSKPGEPPHKQTGQLARSIAWERDGLVARVGTNVKYSRYLELGTSRMAARPFLNRGLDEMSPQINAILSKPLDF